MSIEYSSKDIKVMSDLEHIRSKYGMYIGSVEDPYQLFNEAIDNALDECINKYSDRIVVEVSTEDNKYTIRDYGRGIPIGKLTNSEGSEFEVVELVSTKSFSGGKFNNNQYNFKSGLHGIGLKCINALSTHYELRTFRDSNSVTYSSTNGGSESTLYYNTTEESNGTSVSFVPDPDIFESDIIPISRIKSRIDTITAFGYKVKLIIDNSEIYESDKVDLKSLISIKDDTTEYFSTSFNIELEDRLAQVILVYTSDTKSNYYGYTNLLYNSDGGTHCRLVERSIIGSWRDHYPKNTNLLDRDCLVGLKCLVSVFIPETQYSSQTKDRLIIRNSEVQPLMDQFTAEFSSFLSSNPEFTEGLIKRFEEYRRSQNKLKGQSNILDSIQVDSTIRATNKVRRKSVVEGLVECSSTQVKDTEIYLTEGQCLVGGTKIPLTDGTMVPIEELALSYPEGEIYSSDLTNLELTPSSYVNPRITKYVKETLRITFSDDSVVECTPDHRFYSLNVPSWVLAKDLKIGDSLFTIKIRNSEYYSYNSGTWRSIDNRDYSLDTHLVPQEVHTHKFNLRVKDLEVVHHKDEIPVYCLTVLHESHSFMLSNGLMTHNSASGGIIRVRDKSTQAVLPLRGKIQNTTNMTSDKVIKYDSALSIINAIGCGVGEFLDTSTARYEKIIIATDSDADGCFTGDTRVLLSEGGSISFEEMHQLYLEDPTRVFNVYSIDKSGTIIETTARCPRITKKVNVLRRLNLSSGSSINCTEDHLIMTSTGEYVPAHKLRRGSLIMTNSDTPEEVVTNYTVHSRQWVPVYDMTVDSHHNYLISTSGSSGVVVHNSHIASLILSLFINHMEDLVHEGRVYILNAPRAGWYESGSYKYVFELEDLPETIKESGNYILYKGLGQMSDSEFKVSCVDSNTRKLYKVTYPEDLEEFNKILGSSGGRSDLMKDLGVLVEVSEGPEAASKPLLLKD